MDWFRSWHGAPTDNKWLLIAKRAGVTPMMVSAVFWALLDYASQQEERGSVAGFDAETYAMWAGCYQWMKKNPQDAQQIWANMGIGSSEWTHYFLVGNQANQRTSYMVINILRQKIEMIQPLLFA